MGANRFPEARLAALELLRDHGVKRACDIDVEALASRFGARITFDDLDGATARVIRIGSLAEIRISNRIEELGWRRFTTGHELGHLCLGHVVSQGTQGEIERVCTPMNPDRRASERAASVFASELLMPEPFVLPFCQTSCITLAPARAIAREFSTSVLASAMRFVELTTARYALAYSELGRVRWLKPSATFPDWIARGRRLDPSSPAFGYHHTGTLDTDPHVLAAEAWLPRDRIDGPNVQIIEHAALIPELGAVFSMLWLPDTETQHLDLGALVSL